MMALSHCSPWAYELTIYAGGRIPILLAATTTNDYSSSFHLFWIIVFAVVILKNQSIAKMPTSSKKCMDALTYVVIAYIIGQARIFTLLGASSYWGAIISLAISVPLILYGIVLAIVGLTEYRLLSYEHGKKHAIWALSLGGLYFALVAFGITVGISKKNQLPLDMIAENRRPEIVNQEDNYRMKVPPGWMEMNSKELNANASFAMARGNPQVYFIIISEKIGYQHQSTNGHLLETVKTNLRTAAKEVEFLSEEPMVVGNAEGIHVKARAGVDSLALSYDYWVCSSRGFLYQLVMFRGSSTNLPDEEIDAVFRMFSLLDDNAYAIVDDSTPFMPLDLPALGLGVQLDPKQWVIPEEDLSGTETIAEVQAIHVGSMSRLSIAAYVDLASMPSMDDLAYSLVRKCVTGDFPECNLIDDQITREGCFDVRGFTLYSGSGEEQKEHRIKLYRGRDRGYLVCVEGAKGSEALDSVCADATRGIRFDDVALGNVELLGEQKNRQAMFYNQIGLYYHAMENYATGLDYFRKAHALNLDNHDYVVNCLSAYGRLGQYDSGLEFIASLGILLREEKDIQLWQAWLLSQKGMAEEAIAVYRSVFLSGCRSDEDIKYFMQALVQVGRWDEMEAVCDQYCLQETPIQIPLERAKLLRAHGRIQESVKVLEQLEKTAPADDQVAIELVNAHTDLGEHKISRELCAGYIAAGRRNPDYFYYKAEAEIALKWYREARETLEKGLLIAPRSDGIRESLQYVSGMLGEGDRAGLLEDLDEVALPAEIESMRPGWDIGAIEDSVFNSLYLDRISAIRFVPGKDYRITHRYRVRVLSAGGVADHSTIQIDFDPLCQKVCVHEVSVRSSKGEIIAKTQPRDYYVIDKQNNSYADHTKTLYVPVPQLNVGNIMDVSYTVCYYGNPVKINLFEDYLTDRNPVTFYAVCYQGDREAVRIDSRRISRELNLDNGAMAWIVENPEVVRDEPYSERPSEYLPYLWIAEGGMDWESCGEEYLGLIADKMDAGKTLLQAVEDIVRGGDTKEKAMSAIVKHVQAEYTYRPVEFGVRAYLPNLAEKTMENQYGDCKDLSVLLMEMLKAAGIEADLALVNSQGDINMKLPTLDQFNHMIVYVPECQGGLFIDPTEQNMDFRESPPFGLDNRKSLVLRRGKVRLVDIPPYAPGASQVSVERTCEMRGEGKFRAVESLCCKGLIAASVRSYLKESSPENRGDWIQQILNEEIRQPNIQELTYLNIDDMGQPLIINLTYDAVADIAEIDGKQVVSMPNHWENYFIKFDRMKERHSSFRLTVPFQFHGKTVLKSMTDMTANMLSLSGQGKSQFCRWNSEVLENGEIGMDFFFERIPGVYPREDYNVFCDESEHAIMSSQMKTAIFKK
jgi:tetratricopeptide (TPR) repeat protein